MSRKGASGSPKGTTWRPTGAKSEPKVTPGDKKVAKKHDKIDAKSVPPQRNTDFNRKSMEIEWKILPEIR